MRLILLTLLVIASFSHLKAETPDHWVGGKTLLIVWQYGSDETLPSAIQQVAGQASVENDIGIVSGMTANSPGITLPPVGSTNDFFYRNSYRRTWYYQVTLKYIQLPQPRSAYNYSTAQGASNTILMAQGINPSNYDRITYCGVLNGNGLAYVNGNTNYFGGYLTGGQGAFGHEHGHNWGAQHATDFYYLSNQWWNLTGNGGGNYSNPIDIMGGSNGDLGIYTKYQCNQLVFATSGQKDFGSTTYASSISQGLQLLELDPANSSSGTYRIYAHDDPTLVVLNPHTTYRGITVLRGSTPASVQAKRYWLEFRAKQFQNDPSQPYLTDGLLLNMDMGDLVNGDYGYILPRPGSRNNENRRWDVGVVLGQTVSDPVRGIHITPIAVAPTGEAPRWMDLRINFGAFATNQAPVVSSLTTSNQTPNIGAAINLSATATDPEGDQLFYRWDFGDYTLSKDGLATQSKSYTSAGNYRVQVEVSDGKGKVARQSLLLTVGATSSPTYAIRGRVLANGLPVGGVRLSTGDFTNNTPPYRSALTDSDGTYQITGVAASPTPWTVSASIAESSITVTPTISLAGTASPTITDRDIYGVDFDTTSAATQPARLAVAPGLTRIEVGQSITFSAVHWSTSGTRSTPTALWSTTGGGNFSGATFTATSPGTFTVTGTANGLLATSTLIVDTARPTVSISSPLNNAFIPSGNSIPITAGINTNGNTLAAVELWSGSTKIVDMTAGAGSTWTYTVPAPAEGSYTYVVRVLEVSGRLSLSPPVTVSVSAFPSPWAQADVGTTLANNTSAYSSANGGTFTLAGYDAGNANTNFSYVGQLVTGDFDFVARVITNSLVYQRSVGLVALGSLANAQSMVQGFLFGEGNTSGLKVWRPDSSYASLNGSAIPNTTPITQWLKLSRRGTAWFASRSDNGINWIAIGGAGASVNDNGTMPSSVYLGIFSNQTNTTAFDLIQITPVPIGAPYFTAQPSAQTGYIGQTTSFTATASGNAPLTYQWQRSTDGGLSWANVVGGSGSTSATYTTPTLSLSDTNNLFRVVAANSIAATPSDSALLTVSPPFITITTQPLGVGVDAGTSTTFTTAASVNGTGTLSYKWQLQPYGSSTWSDISGATSTSLVLSNIQASQNQNRYRCVISSPGAATVTTNAAILSILQSITFWNFETNPGWTLGANWEWGAPQGTNPVLNGSDPSTAASGTRVLGYNLSQTPSGGNKGTYANNLPAPLYATTPAISTVGYSGITLRFKRWLGIENSDYDKAGIEYSTNGTTWTSLWTNPNSIIAEYAWSSQSYSLPANADNQATLYIRWYLGPTDGSVTYGGWNIDDVNILGGNMAPTAPASITTPPSPQTAYVGQTATFSANVAGNPAPTLQWQRANSGGSWYNISGATSASYTTPALTVIDNGAQFRLVATNAGGSATSNAALLTVVTNQPPVFTSPASSAANPVTGLSVFLSVVAQDPDGLPAPITYTWSTVSGPATVGFSPNGTASAGSTTATFTAPGNYTLRVTASDSLSSVASDVAFTVQSTPTTLTVSPTSAAINPGGTVSLSATVSDQFSQLLSPQPSVLWSVAGGLGSVTSGGLYTAPSSGSGTATIQAQSGSLITTVSVSFAPVAAPVINTHPINASAIVGQTTGFTVGASGSSLSYQWQLSTNGGLSWNNISGATSTTYTTNTLTLLDNGARYRCIVSNPGGSATSNAALISVGSIPSPTAWWKINDGTGASTADVFGAIPGILTGGSTWTSGKFGQAVAFDGITGYVSLGSGSTLNVAANTAFSVSGWVKTSENVGMIFSLRNSTDDGAAIEIGLGTIGVATVNGTIKAIVRQNTASSGYAEATSAVTVNDGQWHHFALTRSTSGSIQLYIDGTASGSAASGSSSSGAITTDLRALGSARRWVQVGYGTADQQYLNGQLDEVRFYNGIALTLAQINALATASAPTISTAPSPQTVNTGGTATFTVSATGSGPLSYQWRKTGVNLSNTAAVSGADIATLTITGVQAADAGSYDVVVSNDYGSTTSGTVSLTVQTPYAAWIAAYPSLTGNAALSSSDPDGDGIPNLLEYGLSSNPTVMDATVYAPTADIDNDRLRLSFCANASRADITYTVQASGDLATWSDIASSIGGANTTAINASGAFISDSGSGSRTVTVTDQTLLSSTPRRFLRLRIISTSP